VAFGNCGRDRAQIDGDFVNLAWDERLWMGLRITDRNLLSSGEAAEVGVLGGGVKTGSIG
jgi:hypothetical protein